MGNAQQFIVTGGGGFVGRALCAALRAQGHVVISVSRSVYPELKKIGVLCVQADLGAAAINLESVFKGASAVFHTAAKVDMWGKREDFFRTNVLATRNIIAACRASGVRKLIYTSSPSVVSGHGDLRGVNESQPYPDSYLAQYPATKALAEREVLAANDAALATISLRPHLIFGPGDHNFVPTILQRARVDKLVRVGSGMNMSDVCFIDDCVQAHLNACESLDSNPHCRGRAYFITQGEPINLWKWIDDVLVRNGLAPVRKRLAAPIAYMAASICEAWARVTRTSEVPLLTRFLVHEMCSDHYFDISAARRDLGFNPKNSVSQALDLTFAQRP